MIVGISTHFDAAHYLPNYPGKCANMHGHRWRVEVELKGSIENESGMLVDFGILKTAIKNVLDGEFDHRLLNDIMAQPTAENLVVHLFRLLKQRLEQTMALRLEGVHLRRVRLYETPDSWAEVGA